MATVVIWFLGAFDFRLNYVSDHSQSLLAAIGQLIAPIFKPLGFGDWRITTSLIAGFTAKEAVVSTLSVLTQSSASALSGVLPGMFTSLSAVSFLVFTLLYTPCVAAVATIRRELRSRAKTLGIVVAQCMIAWVCAFAVYQAGNLIF